MRDLGDHVVLPINSKLLLILNKPIPNTIYDCTEICNFAVTDAHDDCISQCVQHKNVLLT